MSNAYQQLLDYEPMRLTKHGSRSLVRELSRVLSDEAIEKMLEGIPVHVYSDGDGPCAEIPAAWAVSRGEVLMCLDTDDVVPDDSFGGDW